MECLDRYSSKTHRVGRKGTHAQPSSVASTSLTTPTSGHTGAPETMGETVALAHTDQQTYTLGSTASSFILSIWWGGPTDLPLQWLSQEMWWTAISTYPATAKDSGAAAGRALAVRTFLL